MNVLFDQKNGSDEVIDFCNDYYGFDINEYVKEGAKPRRIIVGVSETISSPWEFKDSEIEIEIMVLQPNMNLINEVAGLTDESKSSAKALAESI